jgi:hypothetical protein
VTQPYSLSCHRRAIRLEVNAPLDDLVECNCSTCRRFGAIHWYVKQDAMTLREEGQALATYDLEVRP